MRKDDHTPMCSACFCQKPGVESVDFQAAWDGPSLKGKDAAGEDLPLAAGSSNMAIDDLVLCADCIRGAAGLLSPDPTAVVAAAEEAERVARLDAALEETQQYVRRLETAVAAKPGGKAPRPPRPQ